MRARWGGQLVAERLAAEIGLDIFAGAPVSNDR